MFNYVKAELWKLTQRPALFLTWGILFLLMVVYSVLLSGREYSNLVAACTVVLVAGVLVAPLLVVLVDDGAWLRMLSEGATSTFAAWYKDQKWNTSLFHLAGVVPIIALAGHW